MKKYDITDNFRERTHTIRVTFQYQEYKGHIAYEIGGNCKGLDILDFDPDCIDNDDIKRFVENDCNFQFDDEYEIFQMILTNDNGDTCEFEDDYSQDIREKIVAIEIIDCRLGN